MCLVRSHLVTQLKEQSETFIRKTIRGGKYALMAVPVLALGAFEWLFIAMPIAKVFGERRWRRTRHITDGALVIINMMILMVDQQLLGGKKPQALITLPVACKIDHKKIPIKRHYNTKTKPAKSALN